MSNKPKLTPPGQTPSKVSAPFLPDQRVFRLKLIASLAFTLLVVAAFAVVVVLPDRLTNKAESSEKSAQGGGPSAGEGKSPTDSQPEDIAQRQPEGPEKSRAEMLLKSVLKQQAKLEAEGVKVWGSRTHVTSYPAVLAKLSEADAHFDAQRYGMSASAYTETVALMDQLDASRPERIRLGFQAGMDAVDRFDDAAATTEFEMVLALDPANAAASHGMGRVRNLARVKALVDEGQLAEERENLEQARKAYGEAFRIDSEFDVVRDHLARVDELIRTSQFELAVSEASSALDRTDLAGAQDALQRARQLRPDATEVRDIGRRLQAHKRRVELAQIRKHAQAQESKERWHKAKQAYRRALAIDPNADFALKGKKRAEQFAVLNGDVDGYLADPHRLQSAETRTRARETWQRVANLDPGRRLRDKNRRLGDLIDAYNKPVPVILRSDGMTDVTLYRVGKLGRFQEQRRELRPGLYTAHGTRSGYRDVKIRFEVPVTGTVTKVSVVCRETI